jgi:hypothetical protein
VRRTWLTVALLACITAGGSSAAVQQTKAPPPSRFGMAAGGNVQNLSGADRVRYFDGIKSVGARWIRIDINWAMIQRNGPRSYDWTPFDRIVKAARRRKVAVLGTLLYTPRWARAPGTPSTAPPVNPGDFAAFAARAARHFGARDVHAYEIWNEPNIASSWLPGPDPARYTQLLKVAYASIKNVDRRAIVVSAGLSPYAAYGTADAQHMNPLTFLEQMYANGAHASMDAVGWHPYNFPWGLRYYAWSAWSQMWATSPSVRSIMRANGDAKKKIWATEWGAPTGTSSQSMTEAAQAQLVRAGLIRLKGWSWAGPSFLYSFRDEGTSPSDREQNFGLVRHDWSRKPAFRAYRQIAAGR